jgi:transposase-like protein
MAVGDYNSLVDTWIEEDKLLLIECWARDGYTMQDIANRIGITDKTLREWRKEYPEIQKAISNGKEIIDYKVENALLKSALGYKTKEVKVTTIMRYGKVVETQKEVTEKDQAPNVTACQVWLYNRCPDKWKKNRDNLIELDEEDTSIQVTVVRKGKDNKDEEDQEWQDEVNTKIEISKNQNEDSDKQIKSKKRKEVEKTNKSVAKKESEDLDYWPDDWEDEE